MPDLPFELPAFVEHSKYIGFFFLGIVEGPIATMAGGLLFRLGHVEFWPTYLAFVFGDLAADIGWYFVGYHGSGPLLRKYGSRIGFTPESVQKAEHLFHRYHAKIIFISKITIGLGFALAILITAGTLRTPLRTYIALNLLGGFIWTGMLITVGYFFGNVYDMIPASGKFLFIVAGLLFTIAFFSIARRKLSESSLSL